MILAVDVICLLVTSIYCFNGAGSQDFLQIGQTSRIRNFPHVDGNYALHVYIPSKSIIFFIMGFHSRYKFSLIAVILIFCDGSNPSKDLLQGG